MVQVWKIQLEKKIYLEGKMNPKKRKDEKFIIFISPGCSSAPMPAIAMVYNKRHTNASKVWLSNYKSLSLSYTGHALYY